MFVRVVELEGVPLSEPAQLEAPLSLGRPRRGDVLEALVRITLPEAPRGTDGGRSFDEAAYLARNGIQVVLDFRTLVRDRGRQGWCPRARAIA